MLYKYSRFSIVAFALLLTINVRPAANSGSNGFRSWLNNIPCLKACKERQKRELQKKQRNKEYQKQAEADALLKQSIRSEALHWGDGSISDEKVERIFTKQRSRERDELIARWHAKGEVFRGRNESGYGSMNLFLLDSY